MRHLVKALEDESDYVRAVVPRIIPILVLHAQNEKCLTYKELALQLDEFNRVRHLDKPLGKIGTLLESDFFGEPAPPLEALVTRGDRQRLPGPGVDQFLVSFLKRIGVVRSEQQFKKDRAKFVKAANREIFSFPWHRIFSREVLAHLSKPTSEAASQRKQTKFRIDPGPSGQHFRSATYTLGHHNPVVLALLESLPSGWTQCPSMAKCDLMVKNKKFGARIFEVKCNTNNQDLCAALGEIIYYVDLNATAKGVLVIPKEPPLSSTWKSLLNKCDISCVSYVSADQGIVFANLDAALSG